MRLLVVAVLCCGCSASTAGGDNDGFATRLQPAPEGLRVEPEPPADVFWVHIAGADVPSRTRGGQLWDEVGGWPDPLAILKVDGKEVMRTSSQTDTIHPSWSEPAGNVTITAASTVTVELEDADTVQNLPIASVEGGPPTPTDLSEGKMVLAFDGGQVTLRVEAAHPLLGLGFDYEARGGTVIIGQVLAHSPAGRAGMKRGDVLLSIGGNQVADMKPRAIKSALNAVDNKPVALIVRRKSGATTTFKLKSGAVYPLFGEYGPVE
jgi:hypothetical protein